MNKNEQMRRARNEQYLQEMQYYASGGQMAMGALQGAASGALAGAPVLPPWGAIVGGVIGGASSLVKDITGNNAENAAEAAAMKDVKIKNRMQEYTAGTMIPTFERAWGGALDSYYTPASRPMSNPYALGGDLEDINKRKQFGWFFKNGGKLPEGNATSKEANEFIKQFPEEMAMGEEVEYEHTGNKKLAQRIAADHVKDYLKMTGTPGYYTAMKQAGISDELNKMDLTTMKNGGSLSASKAQEILKDGKIRGKKISDAQRRLFYHIAQGGTYNPNKANGGPVYPKGGAAIWDSLGGYMYANGGPGFVASNNPNIPAPNYDPTQGYLGTPILNVNRERFGTNVAAAKQKDYQNWKNRSITEFNMYEDKINPRTITPPPAGTIARAEYIEKTNPVGSAVTKQAYQNLTPGPNQELFNQLYNRAVPMENFRTAPSWMDPVNSIRQADEESWSNYVNKRANGGEVPGTGRILNPTRTSGSNLKATDNREKILTEYKGGGTHEENPYGGIQVGGKAKVEDGEFRFDDPDTGESYVFSNRY